MYKIKYEEIKGSVIDGNNVYIYLNIKIINDFVITNKNGFHTIKVTLSNPFLLTQELKFCYNYYYLMNCSKVKELSIKVKNIKKIKKKQYYDIEIPEGFILSTSIQGYKCLLPSNSIITESNNNRIKFRIKDILLLDTFFNPLQKYFIKYMVFTPKEKILKRLHQLQMDIVKANDAELDKIGLELVEIEKQLLKYQDKRKNEIINWQDYED